jgi:autophagy-related protein 9
MATISWQEILERIISIRESNPNMASTAPIKLDAHDIANRIMRKDNYLIALFNKDILNITIPLPYLRNMHVFTRDLEWNLSFCVLSYVFDSNGQIRKRFLKDKNRNVLAEGYGICGTAVNAFVRYLLLIRIYIDFDEDLLLWVFSISFALLSS